MANFSSQNIVCISLSIKTHTHAQQMSVLWKDWMISQFKMSDFLFIFKKTKTKNKKQNQKKKPKHSRTYECYKVSDFFIPKCQIFYPCFFSKNLNTHTDLSFQLWLIFHLKILWFFIFIFSKHTPPTPLHLSPFNLGRIYKIYATMDTQTCSYLPYRGHMTWYYDMVLSNRKQTLYLQERSCSK